MFTVKGNLPFHSFKQRIQPGYFVLSRDKYSAISLMTSKDCWELYVNGKEVFKGKFLKDCEAFFNYYVEDCLENSANNCEKNELNALQRSNTLKTNNAKFY